MKHCPLCGSVKTEVIEYIEVAPLLAVWQRSFQINAESEYHNLKQIELLRCADCSLSFFAPDSLAGSPALYEQLEKFDWYYLPRKWEHQTALEDLSGCVNGMEIGCGFGAFVGRAGRELNIPFEGCEQNPSAVTEGQKNGITVHFETSQNLAKSRAGEFSAVCSFQVLEHVTDPAGFLESCCTLLQSGGKLMLGLPNARSFLRHEFNVLDMPPHHMTRWTAETLTRLQSRFPLKLQCIAYEPLADYHVDCYVDAYAGLLARRGLRVFNHPGIRSRAARVVRQNWIRRHLLGHTIYACYVRI